MTDPTALSLELERRLAALEAQLRAHSERIGDLVEAERRRKQQALWLRVGLLLAALAAFFWLRARGQGG
jgi:predicted nucleic acid-binding Zn ribbon protein